MRKSVYTIMLFVICILCVSTSLGIASELMLLEPTVPGTPSRAISLPKKQDECDWNYQIEYVTGDWYYYVPRQVGDTVCVWFQSPVKCTLCAIIAIRCFDGVADGTQGTPIDYFVSLVPEDYNFDELDCSGDYLHTAASPLVYPLLYGPVTLTSPTENYQWDTLWVTTKPDVGTAPFIGGYIVRVDNQATLADDGSVPMCHSIQYRTQPPGDAEPGWYGHRVNFGIFALVKAYENWQRSFFRYVENLPWTYSTDSRKAHVHLEDVIGIPPESTGIAWDSLYYSINCGPWTAVACSLYEGDAEDGWWVGELPAVRLYDQVFYYHVACNRRGVRHTSYVYSYKVIKGGTGHLLYVLERGAYYGTFYDPVDSAANDFVDYWFASKYGTPDSSVFAFYKDGPGQPTIIWLGWEGYDFAASTELVADFLDAGGNLLLSGQDILYWLTGTYEDWRVWPGMFVYDYLQAISGYDDFVMEDSTVSFYGVHNDVITEPFVAGIKVWPYCWAGPGYNWSGKIDEYREGVIPIFHYETDEISGYRYEDPDKGYKLVFLYWPFDYIVKEDCIADTMAQNTLISNILKWFSASGVEEGRLTMAYSLSQNVPNPVSSITSISYVLSQPSHVSLRIYDIAGRLVKTLVNQKVGVGNHTVVWDRRDDTGFKVGAGIYFCKLNTSEYTATKKMIVVR